MLTRLIKNLTQVVIYDDCEETRLTNYYSTILLYVGLNKGTILIWGQWDLNPRPPAPQANTSTTCNEQKCYHINRDGILDQARRWPLTNYRDRVLFKCSITVLLKKSR